jgi:hypothetical protein
MSVNVWEDKNWWNSLRTIIQEDIVAHTHTHTHTNTYNRATNTHTHTHTHTTVRVFRTTVVHATTRMPKIKVHQHIVHQHTNHTTAQASPFGRPSSHLPNTILETVNPEKNSRISASVDWNGNPRITMVLSFREGSLFGVAILLGLQHTNVSLRLARDKR